MILDAREAIKPVAGAAGLNPADFNANWQNLEKSRQRPLSAYFQDFSHVTQAMLYRFTRERSLVQAQPCPSKALLIGSSQSARLADDAAVA
jgi:hypothetical protein